MYIAFILLIALFIPTSQTTETKIRLTFTTQDSYFLPDAQVDISCDLENPTSPDDSAQLWHVDRRTGRRTWIVRSLFRNATNDDPEIFKHIQNNRIEYPRKNFLRIHQLTLEDSARYECSCPDCRDAVETQAQDLLVMKIAEPTWIVEPNWPLQENVTATFRCVLDDFFPYLSHHIFRHHHEVTNEGQATLPTTNSYPQTFSWEQTVVPTADWHHVPLRCTVGQGNTERHGIKTLEVVFSPRFTNCSVRQHVDSSKEKSTIECSYSGYPEPELQWFRLSDGLPLNYNNEIHIEKTDENHGKYRSVVTFERDKLMAIPLTTTTREPNNEPETSTGSVIVAENYYQQLLHGGFSVKLILDNEEKGTRKIEIVSDVKQARDGQSQSVPAASREHRPTSILLFFLTTLLFYLIQHP